MMKGVVGGVPTTTGGLCAEGGGIDPNVILQFKSSSGPTSTVLNSCTGTTASAGTPATSAGWSCENRCEKDNTSCGSWFPNRSANALYPGDPKYTDTSAYPCTDILAIRMRGYEADNFVKALNSNVLLYNYHDGACQTTCSDGNCRGNVQTPTSGNNVPINIGDVTNTVKPYMGTPANWSPNSSVNYEGTACALDGFTAWYYARWKYRWCWDDTTLFNRHAGSINIPSLPQACSGGLFNVTSEIETFEAAKGYSLNQWQYSNNGTTWTNFANGTKTAADLIGCSIINITGSPVTYFIRRQATFPIDFLGNSTTYGKRILYSDTMSIIILPLPTFVDPTLNTATPTNGTTICKGLDVSATFFAGGGTPYFDAFDEFEYSLNGISNWTAYTPADNINTAFASGSVKIRGRRMSSCTATDTAWTNLVDWPVYAGTTSPNVASSSVPIYSQICSSVTSINGVLNSGSGGADYEYGYSISNGTSPTAGTIVSGLTAATTSFTLNTTGATTKVVLFARRTNVGAGPCVAPSWGIIAYWNLIQEPINPTLNTQTPNTSTICESESVSAIFDAGSQGAFNSKDEYRISIDNGTTWNVYIPGTSVSAIGGNDNVIIQGQRTVGTSTGCTETWSDVASWSIDKIPTGTPIFTISACTTPALATATIDINNLLPLSTSTSWLRTIGATNPSPSTSSITPFTVTNLTAISRFVVTMTNGLCVKKDSVNIPAIATVPSTGAIIAPNNYCSNCTFTNGSTRYFYDDAGRIIASIVDATTPNLALGLTEVCVDINPVQQYITDDNGVLQPYLRRRWTIDPGTSTKAAVTLYFSKAEFDDLKSASGTVGVDPYAFTTPNIDNILITKYPNGSNGVFTPPMSPSAELITLTSITSYTSHWRVVFPVSTFSTFYIHPKGNFSATLPVELISFDANMNDSHESSILTWKTASEKNSLYFEIEKSSNASNWNSIATMSAAGNSNILRSYSHIDSNLFIGINYYRLKIVDIDSSFEYSNIISLNNNIAFNKQVTLYPNPTNGLITINSNSDTTSYSSIKIKDVLGKIVKNVNVNKNMQINKIDIDCSDLAKGSYYICLYDVEGMFNMIKFIKY